MTYTVKAAVLRNDLEHVPSEKVRSIKLDGKELFADGCELPGFDHDCDFYDCPLVKDFAITSTTGTIAVKMDFVEHSHDCDCDLSTWRCGDKNVKIAGRVPMEAVARFTLIVVPGELLRLFCDFLWTSACVCAYAFTAVAIQPHSHSHNYGGCDRYSGTQRYHVTKLSKYILRLQHIALTYSKCIH